ncbi:MAG: glycosyltransferase family 9 protein [Candidatus Algichlamydia australiensis]|nr:glycosyltransferase family 9 protein [Chlamydiales bacterium]
MKRAALIPCKGLGDGIIMLIAANYLKKQGFQTTIYHNILPSLSPWLPEFILKPGNAIQTDYECIFYQNENAPRAEKFRSLEHVHILYHNHEEKKHPAIRSQDFYLGTNAPIATSLSKTLSMPCKSGLIPPSNLVHKKYTTRVAIHPTSRENFRNWPKEKFLKLAEELKKRGFDPQFVMSQEEWENWGYETPHLANLSETAAFLYESGSFIGNDSGLGHLASALRIPTLTLSNRHQHISLWRPSFYTNHVVLPSKLYPKRYREEQWKKLISVQKVLTNFLKLFTN